MLSLKECQDLAISRGGKCLWKCKKESHRSWPATLSAIY